MDDEWGCCWRDVRAMNEVDGGWNGCYGWLSRRNCGERWYGLDNLMDKEWKRRMVPGRASERWNGRKCGRLYKEQTRV